MDPQHNTPSRDRLIREDSKTIHSAAAEEAVRDASKTTLAIVGLGTTGGLVCVLAVVLGGSFQNSIARSPLYLAYCFLVSLEGVIAWSGFVPVFSRLRSLWHDAALGVKYRLALALLVLLGSMVAYLTLFQRLFPLKVDWGLGPEWGWRFAVADAVVIVPTAIAVLTMWLSAVAMNTAPADNPPTTGDLEKYLAHRRAVQDCLWFVGAVLGALVLVTGMLREAMLAGGFTSKDAYPSELIAANGGFFALCIAVAYAPAHGLTRIAGLRIQQRFLSTTADLETWQDRRKKLATLLGLQLRLDQSLKNSVAILAPLVASLVSSSLPYFAK